MGHTRKPFGQRIKKDDHECNGPEETGCSIDRRAREQKHSRADRKKDPGDRLLQETMTTRGAWIFLIQRPVAQTVKEHRGRARQHHAGENQNQSPHGGAPVCRHQKRPQGKGKGKHSM
jgi:hypothetical protein